MVPFGSPVGHWLRVFASAFLESFLGALPGVDFGEIWDDLGSHFGAFLDAFWGRT